MAGAEVAAAAAEAEAGTLATSRPARERRLRSDVELDPGLPAAWTRPTPSPAELRQQARRGSFGPLKPAGTRSCLPRGVLGFVVLIRDTPVFLPFSFSRLSPLGTQRGFSRQNNEVGNSSHSLVSHCDPFKHSLTRTSLSKN